MQRIELTEETIARADKQFRGPLGENDSLRRLVIRMQRKTGSADSWHNYLKETVKFARYAGQTPDDLLKSNPEWDKLINDYLDHLHGQGLSASTQLMAVSGIKKWLATNDALSMKSELWTRVDLPKKQKVETDRLPRKEELRKLVNAGDLCDRVMVMIAVSSGLRKTSIFRLKLRDLEMDRDIPLIRPPSEITKGRASFFTFCTPEAKAAVEAFLKERKLNGEALTPDSFLIPSQAYAGASLTRESAGRKWRRLLQKTGMTEKGHRWYTMHFHTLRKYFKTYATLSGVSSDVVEYLMGHRTSLRQVYFVPDADSVSPEVLKLLEAEYAKAVDALTIFSDEGKVRVLEEKVEEQARQLEDERRRFYTEKDSWEQRFSEVLRELKQTREALSGPGSP